MPLITMDLTQSLIILVDRSMLIFQLENIQKAYSRKDIAIYGLRWLLCFLLIEFLTHHCYFNALAIRSVAVPCQMYLRP